MPVMTMRQAILETIREAMRADERVVVLGEDLVGGMGTPGGPEAIGGIWSTSTGLYAEFGAGRVIDTPISESAIVGAAAGLALTGKRPIAELMFADFVGVCLDQLWNQLAKFRYMFGGKAKAPAIIRMVYGAGVNAAAQHSQAVYGLLTALPGLKVALPATPADARGLLNAALDGEDPVIFMEHKTLYGVKGEVPEGRHVVPFGQARLVRAGGDVTVVAMGAMVRRAEKAAEALAAEGVGVDLLDIRTSSPLDEEAILDSVEQTGRLVVVDESPPRCSLAADIAALVAARAFVALKAPPQLVTAPHTPVPFARELEKAYLPSPAAIEAAVRQALAWRA
ncbi:MAG: alpha-ketoacid dehydrogenase subunit beta [Sphingomonadaceae bacterium]